MEYALLILIGLAAGTAAGLLGIGGGVLTVPSFLGVFYLIGFPQEHAMHVAIGTSLGVMVFTAGSSAYAHFRKNGIKWRFLEYYAPGIFLGVIGGSKIADFLPGDLLKLIFGLYVLYFALTFLFNSRRKEQDDLPPVLPSSPLSFGIGLGNGVISSLLGIGGAMVTVPFLTVHHVTLRNAISTSSIVGFLIAVMGTLSYLYFGLDNRFTSDSLGFIYLPGFFLTGISSVLTAPMGAKLAYTLPLPILRKVFGCFMLVVAFTLLYP